MFRYICLLNIFLTVKVLVTSQSTEQYSVLPKDSPQTKAFDKSSQLTSESTAGLSDTTNDLWSTKGYSSTTDSSGLSDFTSSDPTSNSQDVPSPSLVSTSSSPRSSELGYSTEHPTTSNTPSIPQAAHPCLRECEFDVPPMTCFYRFEVEDYYSMSKACYNCPQNSSDCDRPDCIATDGFKRSLIVVNRQMPGPSIEVCHGDTIVVEVINLMTEQSVSIHWHGLHQVGTPYMDGVPFVTQCPIPPSSTFRYEFVANPAGTFFWHSHLGVQRADGLYGSLIVRIPRVLDPNSGTYDQDLPSHTVQIVDWDHVSSVDKFLAHYHGGGDNKPPTLLVNGRGRNYEVSDSQGQQVPLAKFTVQQGIRYRFRLINAGFLNCPIQLSIDNHNITIIASDSSLLQPIEAQSLVSYAGERFDFVLDGRLPVGNYWLRLRGLMDCDDQHKSAHQVAVIHYEGAADEYPASDVSYGAANRQGLLVNAMNTRMGVEDMVIVPELSSALDDDDRLKPEADMTFYVSYDFYPLDNPLFQKHSLYGYHQVLRDSERIGTPQLNHISMKLPPAPPLSQLRDLDPTTFCNSSSISESCKQQYCECLHLLRVPLGSVVELFIIDEGVAFDANHPFHLHGTDFRVIAMDRLGSSTSVDAVKTLDREGGVRRKLHNAPVKDVVTIPDGGYTALRFKATNPGIWMLHCHIDFHSDIGMALVFQFGEAYDFPPVPRGFPQCGNNSSFAG